MTQSIHRVYSAASCRNYNLARRAKLDGFRRKAARRVEARDGRNHNSALKNFWKDKKMWKDPIVEEIRKFREAFQKWSTNLTLHFAKL